MWIAIGILYFLGSAMTAAVCHAENRETEDKLSFFSIFMHMLFWPLVAFLYTINCTYAMFEDWEKK